jgi:ankyrin repeat protein
MKEWTSRQLTPLHFAAAEGWLEAVKYLIAYGADKYAQDSDGQFPLDIAIVTHSVSATEGLL